MQSTSLASANAKRFMTAIIPTLLLATALTGCSSDATSPESLNSLLKSPLAAQCTEDFATDFREVDKRIREVLSSDSDETISDEEFKFTILNLDLACKRFFAKHQPSDSSSSTQICKMTVIEGDAPSVVNTENFAAICEEAASYSEEMKEGVPENPETEIPVDDLAKILLKDIKNQQLNMTLLKPELFTEALLSTSEKPVMMVYGEIVTAEAAATDLELGATSCVLKSDERERWAQSPMGTIFPIQSVEIARANGTSETQSALINIGESLALECSKKSVKPLNLEDLQASVSGILRIEKAQ